ncbi:MAG: phospholipid carrier-dependent glycosyltransferase [Alphaproteobacteria bacterium]|nr:phospholipid carrier-dependent glycosyltransferase [Alphaproteobacteria bacterium]
MPWLPDLLLAAVLPGLAWAVSGVPSALLPDTDRALRGAVAFALVVGWCSLGGIVLGFTHRLGPLTATAWLGLGIAAALLRARPVHPREFADLLPLSPLLLLLLALGTVPPWHRDSMTYHLALPRFFAQHGGYAPTDENLFASFPLGWESALSLVCAWGAPPDHYPLVNPRLLAAWITVAGALALVGLARTLGAERRAALTAGAAWLLLPSVVEFGSTAYVEPWLCLCSVLAVAFAWRAREGGPRLARAAGLFAGLAISAKYPGLAVAAFVGTLLLPRPGQLLSYGAVAAVVGSPFYLRNLLVKGNPVFPVAWDLFGGPGWDAWRSMAYAATLANYGMGRSTLDTLLLPWRVLTTTDLVGGFEGSLGLAAVGGLVLGGLALVGEGRRLWPLAVVLGLWAAFWASQVQQIRFLLALLPVLFAVAAVGASRRSPALLAVWLLASVGWSAPLVHRLWTQQATGSWLVGELAEADVLERMLPESYRPLQALADHVPEDGRVWLVWTRGYSYYAPRDVRVDSVFEAWRLEALLDEAGDADQAIALLRADGITHLLINRRFFLTGTNADLEEGRTERLRQRFGALVAAGRLRPVEEWGPVVLLEVAED